MFKRHSRKEQSPKAIFEKFMDFLGSSMWNLPIATFLEQRSIVFDREQEFHFPSITVFDREQGDPLLYNEIHEEFGSLVDALMEGFCDDLQIEPEQLVFALKHKDNDHKLSAKERSLLEPVVAAQNFDVFVPMMMRKNIELQLQAVEMIEFLCGVIPAALCIEGDDIDEEELAKILTKSIVPEQYDRYILIKVLRKSKADFEHENNCTEKKLQLEDAVKTSLLEKERLKEQKQLEECEINKAITQIDTVNIKMISSDTKDTTKVITTRGTKEARKLSELRVTRKQLSKQEEENEELTPESAMAVKSNVEKKLSDIHSLLQEPKHIPESDIKARAAYFREQRDKLLKMKRAIREQQFEVIAESSSKERPRTAKVARGAMSGKASDHSVVDKKILEARRALATKLKNEINEKESE